MRHPFLRIPLTLAAVALAGSACASSTGPESAETADRSAPAAAADAAIYAGPGPYDVGYDELTQPDGRRVVVWYPAEAGSAADAPASAEQVIDPASVLRDDIADQIPEADRSTFATGAYADLPPADIEGGAPLVVNSHGYSAWPEISATALTHLASWGFVVAGPDHVERSHAGLFGDAAVGVPVRTDEAVLATTIDVVADASGSDELPATVDAERIAVMGHSDGAAAAHRLAATDDRIDAWVAASVGTGVGEASPVAPEVPGMVMVADRDEVTPSSETARVYAAATSPKVLVKVYDASHGVFGDHCLYGEDEGRRWVDQMGSWEVFPPQLVEFAADGCSRDLPSVADAQPALGHAQVAFLRGTLGIDDEPVALDTPTLGKLGTPVTVTRD